MNKEDLLIVFTTYLIEKGLQEDFREWCWSYHVELCDLGIEEDEDGAIILKRATTPS